MNSSHTSMVPFWRRRTLALWLPACTIAALLVLIITAALAHNATVAQPARSAGPAGPSLLLPLGFLLGVAALGPLMLLGPLLVAQPQPRTRLGTGLWLARALITTRAGVLLVIVVYSSFRLLPLDAVGNALWSAVIIALPVFALLLSAFMLASPRSIRPRELALSTMELRIARPGLIIAAMTIAIWFGLKETSDHGSIHLLANLLLTAALGLPVTALPGAVVYKILAREHEHFHASHCEHCGYDRTGTDDANCPECGKPLGGSR